MLPRSVEHLAASVAAGTNFEYCMFWGHSGPGVGKSCLSNWWESPFDLDGATWPTVEHFMMHAKAMLFGDAERADAIKRAPTPKAAKGLGRKVTPYGDLSWGAHRYAAVRRACEAKFRQRDDLGRYLRSTGEAILVEASPHDRIWGIGLRESDARAAQPATWEGANLLGFALMDVRAELARNAESG